MLNITLFMLLKRPKIFNVFTPYPNEVSGTGLAITSLLGLPLVSLKDFSATHQMAELSGDAGATF
jgi:hypothetical protein